MERGRFLGIIGGLAVFIVLISLIIYVNSDFDKQLINQVNDDEPTDKLIPQIENETQKMQINVKRRYETIVNDKKYWGKGSLASTEDYLYYTLNYQNDLKMISGLDNERKKFAKREINKKQFLENIMQYKEYFNYLKSY